MTDLDLDQAIHAAIDALHDAKVITSEHWTRHLAQIAVEAAAPHLLRAAHAEVDRLRAEVARYREALISVGHPHLVAVLDQAAGPAEADGP